MPLLSSVPTEASSCAVAAVLLRAAGERLSARVGHDVRHSELVLSGARYQLVLGTFCFPHRRAVVLDDWALRYRGSRCSHGLLFKGSAA